MPKQRRHLKALKSMLPKMDGQRDQQSLEEQSDLEKQGQLLPPSPTTPSWGIADKIVVSIVSYHRLIEPLYTIKFLSLFSSTLLYSSLFQLVGTLPLQNIEMSDSLFLLFILLQLSNMAINFIKFNPLAPIERKLYFYI